MNALGLPATEGPVRNSSQTISLAEKFEEFDDRWSPKIVCELNGQYVKLVKVRGEFVWHQHEHEDELFFVVKGELTIELEGRSLVIRPGEMAVIPKGTLHRPLCSEEVHMMLIEPKSTVNTGDATSDRTRDAVWI
jgi:mannose-6-phosphate isomerase-like protein (cupin superfamily)